jgi:hypothetical protein
VNLGAQRIPDPFGRPSPHYSPTQDGVPGSRANSAPNSGPAPAGEPGAVCWPTLFTNAGRRARIPGEFGAKFRAGPRRRALGGLSRRPAHQMAPQARGAGCGRQGGDQCGLGRPAREMAPQARGAARDRQGGDQCGLVARAYSHSKRRPPALPSSRWAPQRARSRNQHAPLRQQTGRRADHRA